MSSILYMLAFVVAIISIFLSINVNSKFKKFSKEPNYRGITGAEVAERMLRQAGIYDVAVQQTGGRLSDHYDPRDKTINLSKDVYEKATIASVAVAAHECGHAIQHHESYAPLSFRTALFPVANIGSRFGIWIFIIGMFLAEFGAGTILIDVGIAGFALGTAFHFITLPVEFNASKRALVTLRDTNILTESEMPGARKVLAAAALTYVAAAAAAIIQLLRLIAIRNND